MDLMMMTLIFDMMMTLLEVLMRLVVGKTFSGDK